MRSEQKLFRQNFQGSCGKISAGFSAELPYGKGCELLKLTKLSVGDISNAVGDDNQLHFSRAFKNIYGVSPKNWRTEQMLKG